MVSKENNILYGVDLNKNISPILVRDAIIKCFYEAHCNVLELARESFGYPSDKKFNEMKKSHVKELVQEIFHKIGGNFNDPTKENLEEVVEHLKKFAKVYRKPEIIKKHVNEINFLINKIENK